MLDKIVGDGAEPRRLTESGARPSVFGKRSMATSVMATLNEVIAPLDMDVATLEARGAIVRTFIESRLCIPSKTDQKPAFDSLIKPNTYLL